MIFKRFAAVLAVALGVVLVQSQAQAATVTNVEAVVGGAVITDTVNVSVVAGAVDFFGAGGAVSPQAPAQPVVTTGSIGGLPNQFTAFLPFTTGLGLSGDLVDAVADTNGVLKALYATSGGSLAAEFGDFFRATLLVGAPDLLGGSTNLFASDVTLIVEEVVEAAPVPLPASLPLLLLGLAGVAGLRRRQS
ncbi:MAG: VPLPA-CTERM sorting domain-containing protein [Pseudomonadota bacterium]